MRVDTRAVRVSDKTRARCAGRVVDALCAPNGHHAPLAELLTSVGFRRTQALDAALTMASNDPLVQEHFSLSCQEAAMERAVQATSRMLRLL